VTAIKPADGPIAVTGASGYIGSWIVQDCLEQGYDVRACVRDTGRPDKVDHLNAMNSAGLPGQVTLWQGDLFQPGSYDTAFDGCSAVIHAGAAVGYNRETPQQVYDGCFTENEHVAASAAKAGTVQRFVFTSSFAAVGHRRPEGYVFTENDWCDDSVEGKPSRLTDDLIPENRDAAYALAKARSERLLYERAPALGFEAMAILPLHVIGPVMCPNHDQGWSWQNCISFMMKGKRYAEQRGRARRRPRSPPGRREPARKEWQPLHPLRHGPIGGAFYLAAAGQAAEPLSGCRTDWWRGDAGRQAGRAHV
jgi:nucleoside-diphosphate-sugar epimerase